MGKTTALKLLEKFKNTIFCEGVIKESDFFQETIIANGISVLIGLYKAPKQLFVLTRSYILICEKYKDQ